MSREKTNALDHVQDWAERAFDAGATVKEVALVIEDARGRHERSEALRKTAKDLDAKVRAGAVAVDRHGRVTRNAAKQ